MYVRRTFAKTSPSLTMPTPILFALPSNPMAMTILVFQFVIVRNENIDSTDRELAHSVTHNIIYNPAEIFTIPKQRGNIVALFFILDKQNENFPVITTVTTYSRTFIYIREYQYVCEIRERILYVFLQPFSLIIRCYSLSVTWPIFEKIG